MSWQHLWYDRTIKYGQQKRHESLLPKHAGCRKLKSFQVAQLVFDITVRFGVRYIDRRSRMCDQMVRAARSGVRNIAEGSQASGTSKKTELKLTNAALVLLAVACALLDRQIVAQAKAFATEGGFTEKAEVTSWRIVCRRSS